MTCFADTSLLLSLVGTDTHSPSAKRWWRKLNGPLVTTALVIFETENRLRSMRLQKLHTKEEARASRSGFQDNPDRDGLATVWTLRRLALIRRSLALNFPALFTTLWRVVTGVSSFSMTTTTAGFSYVVSWSTVRFFKGERTF